LSPSLPDARAKKRLAHRRTSTKTCQMNERDKQDYSDRITLSLSSLYLPLWWRGAQMRKPRIMEEALDGSINGAGKLKL